jgi:hypothetical protein
MPKQFKLEDLWKKYQELVGLPEERMHAVQKIETKRAFMGACGQILILMRDEIGALPEQEACEIFSDLLNQVMQFWQVENKQQN